MPSLRIVPATPLRAVLYLRQSVSREESISLEMQETSGRDYCAERGYEVIGVEADPGISGRTWARPAVQRVMGMIDSGEADVIVLWKWSRLSRSRRDWAVAVDRADVAGGRIESATEPLDVGTASGRFARGVMAEMAAFESERIGEQWKAVHARRIAAGLPISGKPRYGYKYNPAAKIHEPDPAHGPVLVSMYERYVAGESIYALVGWLNAHGHRTLGGYGVSKTGNRWSDRTLRRVLDSGFAAGFITANGERYPGAHDALIGPDLWETYQIARKTRRVTRTSERSSYLLSGMVRCQCGSPMHGGQFGSNRTPKYRCKEGREQRTHTGGYVTLSVVHDAVKEWLEEVASAVDTAATTAQAASAVRLDVDRAVAAREEAALREQLTKATRTFISGVIPESAYSEIRAELEGQIAALEERALRAKVEARRAPAAEVARDLLADWDLLPVEQRRAALRQIMRYAVVTPKRPKSDVEIVAVWDEDDAAVTARR